MSRVGLIWLVLALSAGLLSPASAQRGADRVPNRPAAAAAANASPALQQPVHPEQTHVVTPQPVADGDADGLDDGMEAALLTRFTPFFRFSIDGGEENYRPMDARQYVQWSALQSTGDEGSGVILDNGALRNDPNVLLSRETDITTEVRFREDRFLDPLEDVPQPGGNWARHGFDWSDVLANRNIGLYGHVVPFRMAPPFTDFLQCGPGTDNRDHVLCEIDRGLAAPRSYIKIEYWQFFGYNGVGKPFDLGDHEGDWCTVQVIVDSETLAPVQVHLFAHGYRFGFDLRQYSSRYADSADGLVRELRGAHYGSSPHFSWYDTAPAHQANDDAADEAQNNVLRMMRDPDTGAFEHPVVYVEHGGHEFWPTEAWSYQDAPNHNGADAAHSYLAARPPNLGEVEAPLAETPGAMIIMRYNGRWGAYSRRNSPPQGPALHNGWTWPESSSVRWRLPRSVGN